MVNVVILSMLRYILFVCGYGFWEREGGGVNNAYSATPIVYVKCMFFVSVTQWVAVWAVLVVGSCGSRCSSGSSGSCSSSFSNG